MIRAARIDEEGIFRGVDELADRGQLTVYHLPQITMCDLPPGRYKWIPDKANPAGGAFWPLKWADNVEQLRGAVALAEGRAAELAQIRQARGVERRGLRAARRRVRS